MIDRIKIIWIKGLLYFQKVFLTFVKSLLFRQNGSPKKVLVFRTGSIGDTICALPAIAALRNHFSNAEIHILSNAGNSQTNLVSMQRLLDPGYYDELIDYHGYRPKTLLTLLRKNRYDLVIELPQNDVSIVTELRNMIFFRSANIRSGWGWQVHTCFSFRQTQERNLEFPSETDRLLSILKENHVELPGINKFPLNIRKEDENIVRTLLQESFPSAGERQQFVALVPGAKRPQNRYPIDRFVQLAHWLTEKKYQVVVIGGPEDIPYGQAISVYPGVVSFCGRLTPIQSAILLSTCKLTVSNDTGPMHLSYAVGTPVIGIFSSRDFQQKWFPPVGNVVLRNNHVHCSVCLSETCPDNICMKGISLEKIKDAFLEVERKLKNG